MAGGPALCSLNPRGREVVAALKVFLRSCCLGEGQCKLQFERICGRSCQICMILLQVCWAGGECGCGEGLLKGGGVPFTARLPGVTVSTLLSYGGLSQF